MGLFRRRREPESIRGRAIVGLYGSDDVESVHVAWSGGDAAIYFLVPAYLDKILFNLSAMPPEQERLLQKVEEVIEASRAKLIEYGNGYFASVGVAPLTSTAPAEKPFAEIDVEVALIAEAGVAGATMEFRPVQATNERVAEIGLWMLWDWTIASGSGEQTAVSFLLDLLSRQCRYYRENGMPQIWELGQVPFAVLNQFRAQHESG